MKILVMGLPGSGKTTLATALAAKLQCPHFNADEIRNELTQRNVVLEDGPNGTIWRIEN